MREGQDFWRLIRELGVRVLPNTAGCHSVKEAVTTAEMAREIFDTPWIKLEVIGEADTLQPDVFGLVEAARIARADGFEVFPYTTEDLVVAERLHRGGLPGADALGRADRLGPGAQQPLRAARDARAFPRRSAGRRRRHRPAEPRGGGDGARLRRGPAQHRGRQGRRSRRDGARLRRAAIEAGRAAYLAGPMPPRDMAAPSTPVLGKANL